MRTFNTGIPTLDSQLNGGFVGGSVILLLEDPGAGADVFGYHVVVEGLKNNENILYITTDDTAKEMKESIRLYFKISDDMIEKIDILDLVSPVILPDDAEQDAKSYLKRTRHDPLNGIKNILEQAKYDRVVVNNITYFFNHYEGEEVLKFVEEFSVNSKKNESIFFILMTRGMFDSRTEVAMKHAGDGVIEFNLREKDDELQRRLKILKLKRCLVPKSVMRYELSGKGLKMESVMRVI